jgi:quinone-modifying oxidoreductase subunit QmoC
MAESNFVEADVGFVKELKKAGADTLKKCYQCATCSVACPISPEERPFPRKEMIQASWGLRDKLVGNVDIWLCHYCGNCSDLCPRGAQPGDVLKSIRTMAIKQYSFPSFFGRIVPDPRYWWLLLAIPAALFFVLISAIGEWMPEGEIVFSKMLDPTMGVDLVFVPLAMLWLPITFGVGIKNFLNDIHKNAVADGRAKRKDLSFPEVLKSLLCVVPTILKHDKFEKCETNKNRYIPHLLVFFAFIGLFVVTNAFFVALYILGIHGPYGQINPFKILGNISGIALVVGSIWLISNRVKAAAEEGGSPVTYFDWQLLILCLGLGVTGMLAQFLRLGGIAGLAYPMYYVHLIFIFCLFFYLPFGKLAHLVYRTLAMAYAHYSGRQPCDQ